MRVADAHAAAARGCRRGTGRRRTRTPGRRSDASGSWSTRITWRPASASSAVATRPARPAPITMTSALSLGVAHGATPCHTATGRCAPAPRSASPGGRRGTRRPAARRAHPRRRPRRGRRAPPAARTPALRAEAFLAPVRATLKERVEAPSARRLERDLQDVRAGLRLLGELEAEGDGARAGDALAGAGDDAAAADEGERRVAGAVGGQRERQAALGLGEAQLARGDDVERAGRGRLRVRGAAGLLGDERLRRRRARPPCVGRAAAWSCRRPACRRRSTARSR